MVDARTEITTQLLSDKGYSVIVKNEEGIEEEKTYFNSDFEKKFFSVKTNVTFCDVFIKNALKDQISGEIGKSIIFCVSQKHASKVTQILNQLADIYFPANTIQILLYRSPQTFRTPSRCHHKFHQQSSARTDRLFRWLHTSKARVCVTVGMMTTGYDCEDILNLGMMRPIFSPTDFIQIKGRGTRKYTFSYKDGEGEVKEQRKRRLSSLISSRMSNTSKRNTITMRFSIFPLWVRDR